MLSEVIPGVLWPTSKEIKERRHKSEVGAKVLISKRRKLSASGEGGPRGMPSEAGVQGFYGLGRGRNVLSPRAVLENA